MSSGPINVTFWQNMPSHHMAPVQRELARYNGYRVRTIFSQNISEHRRDMGWLMPELDPAELQFINGDVKRAHELAKESYGINIFGGFPSALLKDAFQSLPPRNGDTHVALAVEAGNGCDTKALLRPLFHRLNIRRLNSHLDFMLAYGKLGCDYYAHCGYSRDKIFPFLYQSDIPIATKSMPQNNPIRIICCGHFERRKGLDILLRSLAPLNKKNWHLELVGNGPVEGKIKSLIDRLGLQKRTTVRGFVSTMEMHSLLREKDICVVPSRFDGWGMLTNEALASGLAVVTTPTVGSKDLVEASGAGLVADSVSPRGLRECLEKLMDNSENLRRAKGAAVEFSRYIDGQAIARYLSKIIEYQLGNREKPPSPWSDAVYLG